MVGGNQPVTCIVAIGPVMPFVPVMRLVPSVTVGSGRLCMMDARRCVRGAMMAALGRSRLHPAMSLAAMGHGQAGHPLNGKRQQDEQRQ